MHAATFLLLASLLVAWLPTATASEPQQASLSDSLALLTGNSFSDKENAVEQIRNFADSQALPILRSLLNGDLYYIKENRVVVLTHTKDRKQYTLTEALTDKPMGTVEKKKLKKIGINNNLRRSIRSAIAALSLQSPETALREAAVLEILKNPDQEMVSAIITQRPAEKDAAIRKLMDTVIAVNQINNREYESHLDALPILSGALYPEVRVQLMKYRESLPKDLDPALLHKLNDAVEHSLHAIDRKLQLYRQVENIFFGLSLGSVLLLVAVGLAITFGVMGVINMAHGEMLMLGAYTTYVVQQLLPQAINGSLFIAIPMAFLVAATIGIAIERGIIRHLYGRPLETLLATFGISLILQQAVRSIFSPLNRSVISPDWMSGSLQINPALSLTYNRLYIILFSLAVLAGLMLLLSKTSFGLQMRAVTQNRHMARAMGIRTDWVDALTFGLGSGIAGMAGVALSQLTNVGPNLGQAYIIDSFMVVVFGGVGNLWGTLFGAMTLGIANKYLEPFTGAVIAKILVLVFIILFIQKKPRGMFALKGRAAE